MAIIRNGKLDKFLGNKIHFELLAQIKQINSKSELEKFLDSFMTSGEKEIFLRRIGVIQLLKRNKKYRDIQKSLGISSGTISKIKDIIAGRGYGRNPNRKRKYSSFPPAEPKPIYKRNRLGRYKGTSGILDPFQILN